MHAGLGYLEYSVKSGANFYNIKFDK